MSTEEVVDDKFVPGLFKCGKCNCIMSCNTIYMGSGTIGANSEPRQCPNECGPMWRVTWKEHAKSMSKSQDGLMEKLIEANEKIHQLETQLASRQKLSLV